MEFGFNFKVMHQDNPLMGFSKLSFDIILPGINFSFVWGEDGDGDNEVVILAFRVDQFYFRKQWLR